MTTLVDIPSCTALHVPTPTSAPLPLAKGDLTLVLMPANPPSHPSATLTLSVGGSSFPLLPNSPVQKVKAKEEHASYQFTPVPADGGMAVGTVRIQMKDSTNQGEWEATESLCAKFEEALKSHHVWDEKILYVNDEFDTAGTPVKGWGETVAATLLGGATALADRITHFTEAHIPGKTTEPKQVPPETAAQVAALRNQSAVLSDRADQAAVQIGSKVHEGGQALGSQLPDSLAKPAEPVAEWEKGDIRKTAESGWEQVTIAAKGAADAAARVGSAVSENAHRAIENKYGKQVDQVAQGEQSQIGSSLPGVEDNGVWRGGRTPSLTDAPDVGDTGANLASTAGAAVKGTSVVVQGSNAATGAAAAKST
ncbi:hypothetical protein JCM24511_08434 [Saitozyma sp. JCM 24511]|nr:hypothetical protein JCM24511_08434 [Saitozyma sp. JCM 24511]